MLSGSHVQRWACYRIDGGEDVRSTAGSLTIVPIALDHEFRPGDDLVEVLLPRLTDVGLRDGDILAITQKVVSKCEGRVVPSEGGRGPWIERETARVLARRGDLVIGETRHGLVCANGGVDASNVAEGLLTLLPEDPDASAERARIAIGDALGIRVAVIVTDTFGRPWREGLVDVAIGCSGMPALVDLRGGHDHHGRPLEATVLALADRVAAAAGTVMGKDAGTPVAVVRGIDVDAATHGTAAQLIRRREDDLFRESPLTSISARRTIRRFGEGSVPRSVIEEAVAAACTAPAPHHTRPWTFVALDSAASRRRLVAAMADAWRRDLTDDGVASERIDERIARSDLLLGTAPLLIVPAVRLDEAHRYPDDERSGAERSMFLLSAGAAIQNLLLAFHAQGFASAWVSSSLFCAEETRAVLGLDARWMPLGTVAVGRMPAGAAAPPRPPLDLSAFLRID